MPKTKQISHSTEKFDSKTKQKMEQIFFDLRTIYKMYLENKTIPPYYNILRDHISTAMSTLLSTRLIFGLEVNCVLNLLLLQIVEGFLDVVNETSVRFPRWLSLVESVVQPNKKAFV